METLQTREKIESLCGATNIAEEIRLLSISSPDTIILEILHLLRVPSDAEFVYSFLSYLLHRRFVHEEKERSIIERRVLNEKLDSLLIELVAAHFSPTLLHVLERCILEFREQEEAVAREQGYKILVDWIRTCLSRSVEEKEFVLKHFNRVERVLLHGVCDVWSVIRKYCASKIPAVIELCSVDRLDSMFSQLFDICLSDSPWQAIEGATFGVFSLLRRFSWESDECLYFGESFSFKKFPSVVREHVKQVLFQVVIHEQQSIRDYARKAFWAYLSRSDFDLTLAWFAEIVMKLGVEELLDAFQASGLLSVLALIVKNIPCNYLFTVWHFYQTTLSRYLAHSASTVRQMTSTIFHQLIVRDVDRRLRLTRLIIQDLVLSWKPVDPSDYESEIDMTVGMSDLSLFRVGVKQSCGSIPVGGKTVDTNSEKSGSQIGTIEGQEESSDGLDSWERKEGCLLSYELILNYLINQHFQTVCPVIASSPGRRHSPFTSRTSACSGMSPQHRSPSSGLRFHQEDGAITTPARYLTASDSAVGEVTPSPMHPHTRVRLHVYRKLTLDTTGDGKSSLTRLSALPCDVSLSAYIVDSALLMGDSRMVASEASIKSDASSTEDDVSFLSMLQRVLMHVYEAMGSCQWELRRMSLQVLPHLVQTLYWLDLPFLNAFLDSSLEIRGNNTFISYFACSVLQHAVKECIRVEQLIPSISPQSVSIQECASRNRLFLQNLPNFVRKLKKIADSCVNQNLTLKATETLATILGQISFPQRHLELVREASFTICQQMHGLFCSIRGLPLGMDIFVGMTSGARKSTTLVASHNLVIENGIVNRLAKIFPDFVLSCSFEGQTLMLPILLSHILRNDDPEVQVALLETVHRIIGLPWSWVAHKMDRTLTYGVVQPNPVVENLDLMEGALMASHHPRALAPTGSFRLKSKDASTSSSPSSSFTSEPLDSSESTTHPTSTSSTSSTGPPLRSPIRIIPPGGRNIHTRSKSESHIFRGPFSRSGDTDPSTPWVLLKGYLRMHVFPSSFPIAKESGSKRTDIDKILHYVLKRTLSLLGKTGLEKSIIRHALGLLRVILWIRGDLALLVPILRVFAHRIRRENPSLGERRRLARGQSVIEFVAVMKHDGAYTGNEEGKHIDSDSDTASMNEEEADDDDLEADDEWDDWDEEMEEVDMLVMEYGMFLDMIQRDFSENSELMKTPERLTMRNTLGWKPSNDTFLDIMGKISVEDGKIVLFILTRFRELCASPASSF
eukprot:TRINITY_DN8483_c0_g1_i1.p1 TRINITY_DN8483_c0_g1~~TRINITY_DN8483_c0_g1_i1.p1  ORF type:complete len:1246 (+),score=305.87 TRINITY_DN8483_c0_g1_i1:183-3920(+)